MGFFGAGGFSLASLKRLRDKMSPKVALYFLGLGLFYIVCAGEEIMDMYWALCALFAAVGLYLVWRRGEPET